VSAPEADATPGAGRTSRSRRLQQLRVVLLTAAVGLAIFALVDYAHKLGPKWHQLSPGSVVAAAVAVVVGLLATAACWRSILADLGSRLPWLTAFRILLVSQVGKYLPGAVWPYLAQMEAGRRHGVPTRRMAATGLLSIAIAVISGLVVAAATLPLVSPSARHRYGLLFVFAPLLLVLLHPRVLAWLLALGMRLIRRPGEPPQLTWRGIGTAVGWQLVAWLANGVQIWFLAHTLGAHQARALPCAVGAFALAWVVGFLVVISPAGAGAREAAMIVALAPVVDRPAAVLIALVSRGLTTVGDLTLAAASWLADRRAGDLPRHLEADRAPRADQDPVAR